MTQLVRATGLLFAFLFRGLQVVSLGLRRGSIIITLDVLQPAPNSAAGTVHEPAAAEQYWDASGQPLPALQELLVHTCQAWLEEVGHEELEDGTELLIQVGGG